MVILLGITTALCQQKKLQNTVMEKSLAIGIDLGTSNSCVAVFEYGTVEIIPNERGNQTTPSYVAFTERMRLIGESAKEQASLNASNTVFQTKRLIGRPYDDATLQADKELLPFNIVDVDGSPYIEIDSGQERAKQFSAEEIASMILGKLKADAETYLKAPVTDAVITVPAYFNNAQRQATKNAGEIAGLKVLRILNEPTAAAVAYGLDKRASGERNVLVFDLGGGTFDVSILTIDDGIFQVASTLGNTHLGGEDFNARMVDFCLRQLKEHHQIDNLTEDKKAIGALRTACEKAKCQLSQMKETVIEVNLSGSETSLSLPITREEFEEMCADLFESTLNVVEKALEDVSMDKSALSEIILVGGSTRIPKIRQLLQDFFDGKPLNDSINADEAVAYGAAIQAAILSGVDTEAILDIILLDVTPLSLGVESAGGIMSTVIPRNTTIPTVEQTYASTNYCLQTNVDVRIFEGERALTKDNNFLGEFTLEGISPTLQGAEYTPIALSYAVNADGILSVSATDLETTNEEVITIHNSASSLSQEDILTMRLRAELYAKEDELERSRIEAFNRLDRYIDQLQNLANLGAFKLKTTNEEKLCVQKTVNEAIVWLQMHELADKSVFEEKLVQLKELLDPIIGTIF